MESAQIVYNFNIFGIVYWPEFAYRVDYATPPSCMNVSAPAYAPIMWKSGSTHLQHTQWKACEGVRSLRRRGRAWEGVRRREKACEGVRRREKA